MGSEKHNNCVREVRKQQGLTQGALAELTGVSRQSINYIEQGTYAPSVYLAIKVAEALNTTADELFNEERFKK